MGGFTARLELPKFIPQEQILGKHVFDSEVVYVGLASDWTYSSNGHIEIIVETRNGRREASSALVPFSQIDRVGEFVLLKINSQKLVKDVKDVKEQEISREAEREGVERPRKEEMKHSDEIAFERLETVLLKKR